MPRSAGEIEAEMAALKVAGDHPMSAKMRTLRAELKALDGPATASVGPEVSVDLPPLAPPTDVCDSDEWKFIERALVEFDLRDRGMSVGLVKNVYETLEYKLKVWRITRDIVMSVGVGKPWPKWATLGRNESTGEKVVPVVKAAPPPPPVAHRRVVPDQAPMPDDRTSAVAHARAAMAGMMGGPAPGVVSEPPEVVEVE